MNVEKRTHRVVAKPGIDAADVAMERYSNGDNAAFAELYDAIAPRLLRFLRKATRDDRDAEDLMQQTLLQIHRERGSFIPGARVIPWASTIARRLMIDSARRRRVEQRLFSDAPAHGELYAREFGYDWTFEALVAEICAHFARDFDAQRERCWIAEQDGSVVGSVFLVKNSATVAKLRLLIVAPEARGNGLGARLVEECIRFARQAGYRKIILWTQSHLLAARAIYRAKGFRKKGNQPHNSFGKRLVAEVWELKL